MVCDKHRSREKPVLKCKKVTFQYEGAPKPQLVDVSLKANMSARIAVLGPNGAGKSTLIKVGCNMPVSSPEHHQASHHPCSLDFDLEM
jgi:ATP-binding cassette, subfamily B, bacterial